MFQATIMFFLCPFLCCYRLKSCIRSANKGLIRETLLGERGHEGLKSFWNDALTEDWAKCHTTLRRHHGVDYMLGLLFHLDGGEIHSNSEFCHWTWGSATALQRCSMDSKYMCVSIPHIFMKVKALKEQVVCLLVDFTKRVLDIIEEGVLPSKGFYNEPFPTKSLRPRGLEVPSWDLIARAGLDARQTGKRA